MCIRDRVQTEKVWGIAEELGLPCLVVLNLLDRERSSLDRSLESLQGSLGRAVTPIQLPIGSEKDFSGLVDLIGMKSASFSSDRNGTATNGEVPEALNEQATKARETLVEMVAEADDSLMEKFFEEGTLSQEDLETGLKQATTAREIFPLVCTSAHANIGIQPLLDAITTYVPSAADHPLPAINKDTAEPESYDHSVSAPSAVFVWKTIADPFAGPITLFRVSAGTLKSDSSVYNLTQSTNERLGSLAIMQGKHQEAVDEVRAGDIGAVAKLKDTQTSDTLAEKTSTTMFKPILFAEPVLSYAIEPKSRGDEEKISGALQRLEEEDPTIQYGRDAHTKQLLLSGQGQLHIEVTVAKLTRRFGVEVNLKLPLTELSEVIAR